MERRQKYDQMRSADGKVRAHFGPIAEWLAATPAKRVAEKRREADLLFHRVGITFAVYGEAHGAEQGAERLIPFDTIPRMLGIPARYMSSHIRTTPPPGQPRLVGADASHTWVSVYCGAGGRNAGWMDLDPTNNVVVGDGHVTLAWGRDFSDVTPMRGVILGGGEQDLEVRVTVTPL